LKKRRVLAWAAVVVFGVLLGLITIYSERDRGTILAVPGSDAAAYQQVLQELAARPRPPRVLLKSIEGPEPGILQGRRPGLAVVSLSPWVGAALRDGRLEALPEGAFPAGLSTMPRALVTAAGQKDDGRLLALPLLFDPLLAVWHRDLIGGAKAAPPADWGALSAAAAAWRKSGAAPLSLAGREKDALLSLLCVLAGSQGPGAAADAFSPDPAASRGPLAAAFRQLAELQKEELFQKASFSYPWADATGLVLSRRAAGILLPLSSFRGLNPAQAAPLITSRVPDFTGVPGYPLVAEVRVLVMPSRGARSRSVDALIHYLSEPAVQRSLADALKMVPARLDAPPRDGAAFEAREAARGAARLAVPPALTLEPARAAEVAAAAATVLRDPAAAQDAVSRLYGEK
jgi:ABC-type glycerol-3-phosphate transport system substrate-binding protein